MGLFKKAKEKIVGESPENIEAGVIEPPVEPKEEKPELNQRELNLKSLLEAYKEYQDVISPVDMANMSVLVHQSEDFALKFAIFAEF